MGNLKMPRWPDEVSRGAGGLLDGLAPPVRGSGLDFLFGEADGQGGLTIGQVDPGRWFRGGRKAIICPCRGQKILLGRLRDIRKRERIPGGREMMM